MIVAPEKEGVMVEAEAAAVHIQQALHALHFPTVLWGWDD